MQGTEKSLFVGGWGRKIRRSEITDATIFNTGNAYCVTVYFGQPVAVTRYSPGKGGVNEPYCTDVMSRSYEFNFALSLEKEAMEFFDDITS